MTPAQQKLHDDILYEFNQERQMLSDQIHICEPLALSLRKPAARRLASATGLVLLEVLCYLLFAGGIAMLFLVDEIYPLTLLNRLRYDQAARSVLTYNNATNLYWLVMCLCMGIGILFLIIGRLIRRVRLKNAILSLAGRDIKTVVATMLNRKAALEAVAERHQLALEPARLEIRDVDVNDIANPGYDAEEALNDPQ